MCAEKMHADEVSTDAVLVQRLLASQFPQWADQPIEPVANSGTDHALYRLGDDKSVRLPRIESATAQVEKEHRWLPVLAPHLPLPIPEPLGLGAPGEGYPWQWSVYGWLPGTDAHLDQLADPDAAATALAEFVTAFRRIDPTDGPAPGQHNVWRGCDLSWRDEFTRSAITSLADVIDPAAATAVWEVAIAAPQWSEAPVWIHGDLHGGNMLAVDAQLSAVIDFGCIGVGDPACDLMAAWTFLTGEPRNVFRDTLGADDAAWARGRGWALSSAVVALPYYETTNPTLAAMCRNAIDQALNE